MGKVENSGRSRVNIDLYSSSALDVPGKSGGSRTAGASDVSTRALTSALSGSFADSDVTRGLDVRKKSQDVNRLVKKLGKGFRGLSDAGRTETYYETIPNPDYIAPGKGKDGKKSNGKGTETIQVERTRSRESERAEYLQSAGDQIASSYRVYEQKDRGEGQGK